MSAGRIFMAPGTSIGAAAPVYATGGGMEQAPEKEVSAVRTQMAALAEKNGYPVGVALAMVDADVELLEVYLGGKLTVATSEELPDLERRARQENLTLEKGRIISPKGKLLTLTAGEAERYGVSSGTVAGLEGLLERLEVPAGQVTAVEESAADRLVAFVTGSAVTAILVIAGLVALYIEITTPGFGLPGTVALICFGVVFLGGALLGTVGSLELLIFLAGLTLLLVEVFLIPGFGITGITGILAMAYALVFSRLDFTWPRFTWQWDQLYRGLLWTAASVAGSVLAVALLYRYFPRIAPFRRLFLTSSQDPRQGYTVQEESVGWKLVGRQGVATSPLRPAGKAQIDGEPVDVVTDGEFLPAGTPVEVAEVSGNRIVVRRVRE
jgi:membrane-bound serine protease (ClpP class)